MNISAIAAVGQNWELGKCNDLIWRSKADLAHFKQYTMGKVLIVGRKTYESMPALAGRTVVCVSRSHYPSSRLKQKGDFSVKQSRFGNDLLGEISGLAGGKDIVLAGGGAMYELFATQVTELVLTRFPYTDPAADTYFPEHCYRAILGRTENVQALDDNIVTEIYRL